MDTQVMEWVAVEETEEVVTLDWSPELLATGRFDSDEEIEEEADFVALEDEIGYMESRYPFLF